MTQNILIITVGIPDKVVTTLQNFNPDHIIFIASDGENGSKRRIINPQPSPQSTPTIIEQIHWTDQPHKYDIIILQNPDDLEESYQAATQAIQNARQKFPGAALFADYSSGTKNMSVGLALAAVEQGITLQSLTTQSLSPNFQRNLRPQKPIRFSTPLPPQPSINAITAFRIGNFKAFSDSQYIPIRPLTLIYGANSAGKSSIIHSLLLGHHAIKKAGELDIYRTEAGGESVDLGGFGQYVYRRDFRSQVQWAVDLNPKHLNLREADPGLAALLESVQQITVGIDIGTRRTGNGRVRVRSFFLEADGSPLLQMSSRPQGKLQLDRLNSQHPIIRQLIDAIVQTQSLKLEVTNQERQEVEDVINQLVPQMTARVSRLLPTEIQIESQGKGNQEYSLPLDAFK